MPDCRWFSGSLTAVIVAAGCSSGSTVADTIAPPKPLQILVTNDDGFAAPGIDGVAASHVEAFHNGFIAVTQLDASGRTVTTSTTWPST